MARTWTYVRPVDERDWTVVHALWCDAVAELPVGSDTFARQTSADRLRAVLQRDGVTALVAVHDDRPIGLVVLTDSPLSGLTDDACSTVEMLYVAPAHRGKGVGAELLTAVADIAQAQGATRIASTSPANLRGAHRYYARLGFGAAVTRRVVPTAALRRRLAGDEARTRHAVVARRRSLAARARGVGARGGEVLTLGEHPMGHTA